jgi:1,2-dihydroxy-3-keto-5-methylthiopentene dioxygenase
MVQAWYIKEMKERPLEHLPAVKSVELQKLLDLGFYYRKVPREQADKTLEKVQQEREFKYSDEVVMNHGKEQTMKEVSTEHWHPEEEIRYVVDGCGYLDVRDEQDKWIRLLIEPGDLFIVPPRHYHRFTVTDDDYIRVRRFYKNTPKRVAFKRSENIPA